MPLTKASYSMIEGAPNNVRDFGAVGDNGYRPLSGVTEFKGQNTAGWSLSQWQTLFPHVVSLSQTLDWAAIQAAINYASRGEYTRESVYIPDGYYVITTSLQLPNFATIIGQSTTGTIINNQNIEMTEIGQIVNKEPGSFIYVTMKNLTLRGGERGININVSGETANCVFENVNMDLHTDFNVQVNKLLQTSKWINCTFADADYGLYVPAFTSNLNNFINCEFNNHEWSSVYFRSSEVNNFIGCRFEGGGVQGRATIDVTDTRNLNLIGCYFEATHEIAIGETGSCNSIVVDGCHFTGAVRAGQAGWFPYNFNSDGIIQFGNNNWGEVSSVGPEKMFSNGMNWSGKSPGGVSGPQLGDTGVNTLYTAYAKQKKNITSKWIPAPAGLSCDLLHFTKPSIVGATSNVKVLTGKLTIHYYGLTSGGFEQSFSREYLVFARAVGFSAIGSTLALGANMTVGSATLTVQQKTGADANSMFIEAVFTGINPATDLGSMLQWSFDYMHGSVVESDYIECAIAY